VLVVPRPKNVPRPSAKAAALKGTLRGGVHKAGPAPKFMARQQAGPGGRQTANRNVKVTIGNKLRWVGLRVWYVWCGQAGNA
jgi:hypothetical protein